MMQRIFWKRRKLENPKDPYPVGIKVLWKPDPPAIPSVDIVFVHGLTGNRDETWTEESAARLWPASLLPKDIPDARISTFGYDADVVNLFGTSSQNRIRDHGRNLLGDLTDLRENTETVKLQVQLEYHSFADLYQTDLPVIFVAHSLGGLVCENALTISNTSENRLQKVLDCTHAIAFLGTPHCGAKMAEWATIGGHLVNLVKRTNTDIVGSLNIHSEVLAIVQQTFHTMIKSREDDGKQKVQITCFAEEKPVQRLGLTAVVVPYESAILSQYTAKTIHSDHVNMTKFASPEDKGYMQVSSELRRWVKGLKPLPGNHVILEATKWLATLPRDNLEERVKQAGRYIDRRSTDWFNNRPEFKRWSSDTSSQFLWYARESDSGITSYQVRQLLDNTNMHKQDLAYFFCSPSIPICEGSLEQPLTPTLVLCSIIAQLLHSDYDGGKDDRLKCINSTYERRLLEAFTSARPVSDKYLFDILKCLMDTKPNWEIQIVIDSIDNLPQEDSISLLRRLRHLWDAMMQKAEVVMKVLVTSRWTERIQEILKNLPFIDQEAEASECLASLRPNAYNIRQMHVSEGQRDTGDWIWKNQAYNDWEIADRSSILWIQGKPGSGKSTLSKRILGKLQMKNGVKSHAEMFNESGTSADSEKTNGLQHRLQRNAEARRDTTITAGFFYNHRGGKTETKHAQMLHSLLFQVLQQDSRLFTSFREVYRNLRENSGNTISWSYEDLKTVFLNLTTFDKFPLRIYFVVDAMDESDKGERARILSLLSNACSEPAPCVIKSTIASRPSPDIRMTLDDLKDCHQIVLENENRGDIKKVVEAGLVPVGEALGPCSSDFQFVYSYLTENSHGVFLWVELVIRKVTEYVREGATGEGMKIRVMDIPEELHPFYSDIIKKLNARDKYDIAEAIDMLTWASFAARPLEVREFGDAIAISTVPDTEQLDSTALNAKRYQNLDYLRKGIKSRSGGLLEVTIPKPLDHFRLKVQPHDSAGPEIVQLLHQTVKDFLLTEKNAAPFNANVAHGDRVIASACIRYLALSLSYSNFPEDIVKEIERWELRDYECFIRHLEDRPLLNYALSCLPLHLNRLCIRKDPAQKNLLQSLQNIQEQPENYCWCFLALWLRHYGYASPAMQQMDYARNFVNTTLVTAAKHGFIGVVKSAIEAKASVDGFDEKNTSSPLVAAAKSGRCDVAKILIENGATLGLSWEARGTALHAAIAAGDINMVKILLIRGASTGARDSSESTALTAAARAENHDIVKLLTDVGADISARDERGWTALHRVVGEGKGAMVELLVASGVPANALTNDGLTALHLAEANQNEELIEILLEQERVDPNAKDKDGRTPLARAIENGHEAVVELLLEQERVDPNAKDSNGRTPLVRAAGNGDEAVVELLLEKATDVDVDSKDNNGRTPLSWAAGNGHGTVVKLLLEKAVDIDSKDTLYGQTPLSWAAGNGHEAVVKLLLEKAVNVDCKDFYGQTPLSWAAVNGHEAVVKLLLEKAVNVNFKDSYGWTPLARAAQNGHKAVVKLLLEKAVDVDSNDMYGRTPLSWAAQNGYEAVVKLLLEKTVDVDSNDIYGRTPLWGAAGNGHETVVELLLEKATDVDSKDNNGRTPLSGAAENGHEAVVELLLEQERVDPNAQDKDGRTPLSWAAENGHEAVVKLLLEKSVDVDFKETLYGRTPLSRAAGNGHEATVKLLLKKAVEFDFDFDFKDNFYGRTPLSWAAENGHEAVVKLLLEKAVDVDSKDTIYSRTPLSWAAENGHEEVVKLLLEKAVDVDSKDDDGQTPLSWAAENGHEEVVELLLEKAVDVDSKDNDGRTPLWWAAENGHEAVVKLLLEKAVDIDSKDKYGRTPRRMAAQNGHDAVVELLKSKTQ